MASKKLSVSEAKSYQDIGVFFTAKNYKKGLKMADKILKQNPDHADTLAMKAITLNAMDRKSEAYPLVISGLKHDLNSLLCWHVLGQLYISDRKYKESLQCYQRCIKLEPQDIESLWWLSILQVEMRDWTGYVKTRHEILKLTPTDPINWIGLAVAYHLNSKGFKAIEILDSYEGVSENELSPENERGDHGELLLYKVSIMEECNLLHRALEELHLNESRIWDKVAYKEQLVSVLVKLGCKKESPQLYRALIDLNNENYLDYKAESMEMYKDLIDLNNENYLDYKAESLELYKALIDLNNENYRYYEGLQESLGLSSKGGQYSSDAIEQLDALYRDLGQLHSHAAAVKRRPLDFLQGEKFREAADNYIRTLVTKGTPSLFSDLSSLYDQPGKADILEKLILELEHSIRTTGKCPGREDKVPPSMRMWTLFLLAQHYDRRGQYEISLSKIDEAIEHTPTVIDLYSVKGRILKHAGDFAAAVFFANEARILDLSDRSTNSDCVKRMLQDDQVTQAEKTAALFSKVGHQKSNSYDMHNRHDMQLHGMWSEIASGESFLRQGDHGQALRLFLTVEMHYAYITDLPFYFHLHCLRKRTLRTYVKMIKPQYQLHSHKHIHKAVAGAVRCYIDFYDTSLKSATDETDETPLKSATDEGDETPELIPSKKKKLTQKQRKAERAKKATKEKNDASGSAIANSGKRNVIPINPGRLVEMLEFEDPLSKATKHLKLLQKWSSESLETHLLSFDVFMTKQKILLALQAVKKLNKLDADNPDSHCCLIIFFQRVDSMPVPVTDSEKLILSVLEAERKEFSQLDGNTLVEANKIFLDHWIHKDSLIHRAAAAEMLFLLEPNKKADAIKLIEGSNNLPSTNVAHGPIKEWKLEDCVAVHKLLETVLEDSSAASRWQSRCQEYFPRSTYFKGSLSSVMVAREAFKGLTIN